MAESLEAASLEAKRDRLSLEREADLSQVAFVDRRSFLRVAAPAAGIGAGLGRAADGEWKLERYEGEATRRLTRAVVFHLRPATPPKRYRAAVVLCPGANGNGQGLLDSAAWRSFAQKQEVALFAIHFQSPVQLLYRREGYYTVQEGSGAELLAGIAKMVDGTLPLLLHGFSGGAHFSARLSAWHPGRVMAFSMLGAGDMDDVILGGGTGPPGLVAAGNRDFRFSGAEKFFVAGREKGRHWSWVALDGVDHRRNGVFEDLTRDYFASLLAGEKGVGLWIDRGSLEEVDPKTRHPSLTSWWPERKVFEFWKEKIGLPQ